MRLSLLDLRKKPSSILDAVEHNEDVIISSRGRDIARVTPIRDTSRSVAAETHPSYGMWADRESGDVEAYVRDLRKSRYNDI